MVNKIRIYLQELKQCINSNRIMVKLFGRKLLSTPYISCCMCCQCSGNDYVGTDFLLPLLWVGVSI